MMSQGSTLLCNCQSNSRGSSKCVKICSPLCTSGIAENMIDYRLIFSEKSSPCSFYCKCSGIGNLSGNCSVCFAMV